MLGYEASSPYELEQQRIEERIRQLAGLKDAQTIDSPNYVYFQAQIDSLTAAWRQWDTNTNTLVDMDSKIAVAEGHVRHAVKAASTTPGGWLRAAGVLGSFGALCVAVSMLVTTTVMVPLAGGVLLVFGVGSMLAGVAARRGAEQAVEDARRQLRAVKDQRTALIPEVDAGQQSFTQLMTSGQ